MRSLEWYLWRASAMSPAEVVHRFREVALRRWSRRLPYSWEMFDHGDAPLAVLQPVGKLTGSGRLPDEAVISRIDGVAEQLSFLGQAWPPDAGLGKTPRIWSMDPVTGHHWSKTDEFCFDVKWRGDATRGDLKLVLELNRLQFLQPISAAAMRNEDTAAAEQCAEILLDWMAENPPFQGINWLFGIELALRLVSCAFVAAALETTQSDGRYRRTLRRFIAAHAYWIDRFPSLHSSANNHQVAEGLGLLVAGELVPDLPKADHYRSHGRSILMQAAFSQFHPDGIGVEQSPTYAAFTLEMLLLGMVLLRSSEHHMWRTVEERVEKAAGALRVFLDVTGHHPRIGDDDEGRVIACPEIHEDRYVASVVAAAAGVLDSPQLAPPARDCHLRDLVFGSPNSAATDDRGVLSFKNGGYTVIRDRIARRNTLLVFDHGPLGMPPLAAHGHADALSVWLHLDGQPIFVDAGTYRYHANGDWRDRLRATASHNTLEVGGLSQSEPAGPFNWKRRASSRLLDVDTDPDHWHVTGSHDGYARRLGIVHQRTCRRTATGFEIEDFLAPATDNQEVQIGFLLHPELGVTTDGTTVLISLGSCPLVRMTGPSESVVEIASSETVNAVCAYSARYNELQPTSRIVYRPANKQLAHTLDIEIIPPAAQR